MEILSQKLRNSLQKLSVHGRVVVSAVVSLEKRVLKTQGQLLEAVPAKTYFELLDRHMVLLHDRFSFLTVSTLGLTAFQQPHTGKEAREEEKKRTALSAATFIEHSSEAELALTCEVQESDSELASQETQRSVALQAMLVRPQPKCHNLDNLIEELEGAKALNVELQGLLQSESKSIV